MLSENIKAARENAGLKKSEVARRIGVPYSTYDGYEIGRRTPKYDMIIKIAKALGVETYDLMGIGSEKDAVTDFLEKLGFEIVYYNDGEIVPIFHDHREGKVYKAEDKKTFEKEIEEIKNGITSFSLYNIDNFKGRLIEIDEKEFMIKQAELAIQRQKNMEEHEKKMQEFRERLKERENKDEGDE